MPNFKLGFRLVFDDEIFGAAVEASRNYILVVSADSPEEACVIGESLIGQQVFERESLGELYSVEEAEEGAVPVKLTIGKQIALY